MFSTSLAVCLADVSSSSSWQIVADRQFVKDLRSLNKEILQRLFRAIREIARSMGEHPNRAIVPVKNSDGILRYRVGERRLLFVPDSDSRQIRLVSFCGRDCCYARLK
jgi:mRNA-degrading endonuclease RelE of RelBE toxin-antitoxin system